jgi:hypothetical protein
MNHLTKNLLTALPLLWAGVLCTPANAEDFYITERSPAAQANQELPFVADFETELTDMQRQVYLDVIDAKLAEMQRLLDEQNKLIEAQKKQIEVQQTQILGTSQQLTLMQSQVDQIKEISANPVTTMDPETAAKLADLEKQLGLIPDDPSTLLADDKFPGAIRVPGTTAAYKIGGFVKAAVVNNFDPLVTPDRFIVGSIPVTPNDQQSVAAETSLTANQTRVNFDYRQRAKGESLRAFVEGDFFGDANTFRLRHAFGQYKDLLAGKTWSAFYDAEASPEEVDFEGINGHVLLRQTQVRYFPKIGEDLQLMVSLEDPSPQVTGGEGVSQVPDLVASIRRNWFGRWHIKSAVLLRQIRANVNAGADNNGQECTPETGTTPGQPDGNGCIAIANAGSNAKTNGWALTLSGKVKVPLFGENDNLLWQLNYGEGLGRYLTDLASIESLETDGGQDGIINATNGTLAALPVFGGYVAYQHWWARVSRLRSNFILAMIDINNLDYQPNSAYKQTQRIAANLIWSPIPSIDLGGSYLWGKRINKGPVGGIKDATATQLQLQVKYNF